MPATALAISPEQKSSLRYSFETDPLTNEEFRMLSSLIYEFSGITLSDNKKSMLESRLIRRIKALELPSFSVYCKKVERLNKNDPEARALINAVTTNLTQFFRESHHFDFVSRTILPSVNADAEHGARSRSLRIWHAGCSTGQEAYSLAMTFHEALGSSINRWDIKSLASDIDTNVLQTAKEGIYREDELTQVPHALQSKYFAKSSERAEHLYQVDEALRKMIAFKHINLLEDPWPLKPTTKFDIIFCRNVVIYFDQVTQKRLFARLTERLVPGGILFIGHSESLYRICTTVEPVGTTTYQKPR